MKMNVLNPPALRNEEDTRAWVLRILSFADLLADLTPNLIDDNVVLWLVAVVENDETWVPLYDIIIDVFENGADAPDEDALLRAIGSDPKLDPALIALLIQLAMQFFEWWKNR